MTRIVAIAQMTPGPIAVNAATFAGFLLGGIAEAAVAAAAFALLVVFEGKVHPMIIVLACGALELLIF
jgi:chromate transport protein ChrA